MEAKKKSKNKRKEKKMAALKSEIGRESTL